MTKLHMRRRAILAAAPALVAAPYVVRAQTGKPEKTKVVLAVGGKSALYYLSLTIAETKGFFKDAGLDVEINDFQGGAKALEALMGGSADVVAGDRVNASFIVPSVFDSTVSSAVADAVRRAAQDSEEVVADAGGSALPWSMAEDLEF